MPTHIISGKKYLYTIARKSINSLNVRIVSRRSFKVSAPRVMPLFMISRFIKEHEDWIVKNSSKFSKKLRLKNLKKLTIIGIDYELLITKSGRDSVVIFKDEHKIYANTTTLSNVHLKKLFDTKFRPMAQTIITSELQNLSNQYGFKYNHVTVKNTTSRFGSCSSTNNLNFNWQIIFFPVEIFRHILLHELTHTIHHNHSSRFWSQFAQYDPSWRANRHYLRTHGPKHFII
jgi:predicted metal-dependent hydrolase